MPFFGGDTKVTWAARQKIWRDAIGLCRSERGKFETALDDIQSKAGMMATQNIFGNFYEYDVDMMRNFNAYVTNANKAVAANGNMTGAEHMAVQDRHTPLYKSFTDGRATATANGAASLKLKALILK